MGKEIKSMRLDKFLTEVSIGSRSQVKELIRKGRVTVGEDIIKKPEYKIDPIHSLVFVDAKQVTYLAYEYYMLNKPAGVVSATKDNTAQTVVELIKTSNRSDLFPVGRLDKDTEGLLLITNDGELAHRLLAPKKHVDKVYYARVSGAVTQEDIQLFANGLEIDATFTALPAKLEIIASGEMSEIKVTIQEGKFHQVKRMFEAVGKQVIYLKRLSMGTLQLDDTLMPGQYRELTKEELKLLVGEDKVC